jgi:molybdenum cofactor biosynthesis protein B
MSEHRRDQKVNANIALIITSNTRTINTDETGKLAIELLEKEGHEVSSYVIVPNEEDKITEAYDESLRSEKIQVIITSGGTGISILDKTVDTISTTFEKEMPGFGELFRRLSFDEIGPSSTFSRSTAGLKNGKLVYCLPGSKGAMRTALKKIILPTIGHLIWEVNR